MTEPIRVPGDARNPIIDALDEFLQIRRPGTDVAASLPEKWEPRKSPPFVVVFDDSGPMNWPVSTKPTIRVTVWSGSRDVSWQTAALCLGYLLTHRIPGIATIRPGTNLLDSRDSKNQGLISTFTVNTQVRTQLV